MTHTYATLEVSAEAFDEIAEKLKVADYGHAFDDTGTTIDMHGIGLIRGPSTRVDEKPSEFTHGNKQKGRHAKACKTVGCMMCCKCWCHFVDEPSEFEADDPRATI